MEPIWIDLFTSDMDRSRQFYGELLGWTSEEPNPEFGGYVNFSSRAGREAGAMTNDGSQGQPDLWSVYFRTDDAEKTAETVTANGGVVHVPPMAVGDLGIMAMGTDAGGAWFGLWQPGTHAGYADGPSWVELHTRDYDATLAFYRDVLGADLHTAGDEPGFRYTTVGEGEGVAGIMDAGDWLPEGVPAHWSVYFATDDADATVAKALSLGGAVVQPVEDTPYGRLATLTDATGALFKLRQA